MIAQLKGNVLEKTPGFVILDVQGVGYQAFIPLSTYYDLPETGKPATLHIHTHVSQDAIKLYGFLTVGEKNIFETLIGVNKVGPKLALTILSGIPVNELFQAVSDNDISRLNSIPGVGRKTAERLVLELKDKLPKMDTPGFTPTAPTSGNGLLDDAVSALVNLGYKKPEAEKVLKQIWSQQGDGITLEDLIKESLNSLN